MFYVNRETELNIELLQKMINRFRVNVEPKLKKYKNYYDGVQKILNKSYTDESKPCNKTVINYCKNIADSYCGYLATPSYISYRSKDDIEEIMNVLRYNDYQAEDCSFLLDALVYGVACELMYIDTNSQTRFRLINPTQCFGVYDDSLTGDLMYFVRMYEADSWDNSDLYYVDVYSDGNYSGVTFGSASGALTNDLIVYYKYVDSDGTDSGWLDISDSVAISSNTYSVDLEVTGLDYTKKYNFYAKAVDVVSSVTTEPYPVKTIPVFDWGENDFNFNVPVTVQGQNLSGLLNALTTSYSLTGTATAGDNYSSVSISRITLVGNSLVVYFSATRNSAVEGNITNEIVANVKINHSGKIKEIFNISFANGTTGAVASLQMFNASVSGNYATFDIYLAATGTSTSTLAGYIVIPVTIDLNKY